MELPRQTRNLRQFEPFFTSVHYSLFSSAINRDSRSGGLRVKTFALIRWFCVGTGSVQVTSISASCR